MKSIITTRVECDTDNIQFGYYDSDNDEFVAIESVADATEAAEKLRASPELLAALATFADVIRDWVGGDLRAIWQRLDDAGI